jgi:hypothetical protein
MKRSFGAGDGIFEHSSRHTLYISSFELIYATLVSGVAVERAKNEKEKSEPSQHFADRVLQLLQRLPLVSVVVVDPYRPARTLEDTPLAFPFFSCCSCWFPLSDFPNFPSISLSSPPRPPAMLPSRVVRSVQASAALRSRVARPSYLSRHASPESLVSQCSSSSSCPP